uniref:Secreted protein n=1 Tax=Achlya hypogyna TaxID=1202772 RepID=A0A0A7CNZ3_ACHHY|nr:secreted protein [Achlya hypogyna]
MTIAAVLVIVTQTSSKADATPSGQVDTINTNNTDKASNINYGANYHFNESDNDCTHRDAFNSDTIAHDKGATSHYAIANLDTDKSNRNATDNNACTFVFDDYDSTAANHGIFANHNTNHRYDIGSSHNLKPFVDTVVDTNPYSNPNAHNYYHITRNHHDAPCLYTVIASHHSTADPDGIRSIPFHNSNACIDAFASHHTTSQHQCTSYCSDSIHFFNANTTSQNDTRALTERNGVDKPDDTPNDDNTTILNSNTHPDNNSTFNNNCQNIS